MQYFLGIDIGTYESKGVLTDKDGFVLASATHPHKMLILEPGWAEHRPEEDWWNDFVTITKTILKSSQINPKNISCIATSAIGPCMLPVSPQGEPLMNALKNSLLSNGISVENIGIVTSPLLYYAAKKHSSKSGIMVTGSHNPKEYNGIKMIIDDEPVSGKEIFELIGTINNITNKGTSSVNEDVIDNYIEEVKSKSIQSKYEIKVVIDCGNGAAGVIAPKLFKALGFNVVEIYSEVDGNFPNHHPDPGNPENLKDLSDKVLSEKANIGLAFDGDGDRLGVVDNLGNLVWADQYMLLLCTEIANLYDNPKIIMDVKCSKVFFDEAKKLNCDPIMSKTGHSPIKEKMKELKSPLSGEMSGHVCYADDFYGYDDAMYVALRLLRILCNQEKSLNELINIYPKTYSTPETRFDVDETKKFLIIEEIKERIKNTEGKIIDIDGIRVENDDGWFLMRASNTQNQLTCRAESTSQEGLKSLIAIIENQLSLSGVNYKFTV